MFSSKFLVALLALLCAVASSANIVDDRQLKKKRKKKKKKPTVHKWRVKGTASPDASGACYPGDFYDKKGKNKLGTFLDCVVGAPVDGEGGSRTFPVLTTFTPDDGSAVVQTTCEITVTPAEEGTIPKRFNARERCRNRSDGAVILPEGAKKGVVKMDGKVNNLSFPELTFDLLWTIKYKEPEDEDPVFCTADVKQCADGSFVSRDPENGCAFDPCPECLNCGTCGCPSSCFDDSQRHRALCDDD